MIFFLLLFLAVGLAVTVGPAIVLGLTVALLAASLRLPTRIALLLVPAIGLSLGWIAVLHGSSLLPVALALVIGATATSGAAGMAWTAHRRRSARPRVVVWGGRQPWAVPGV
ncbi:hypothetical protein [Streptacidiphilus rugosus]|uniref:hypothetical protein n=1 Tax=Streptacidiphilus rugosus TaxID=405783 RepID=UPI000564B3BD|nr:hypothetical protein [Streptacidiphilus rugosus]